MQGVKAGGRAAEKWLREPRELAHWKVWDVLGCMVFMLKKLQPGGHWVRARTVSLLRVFVVWEPSESRALLDVPTHALLTDWTAGPRESKTQDKGTGREANVLLQCPSSTLY